MSNFKWLSAPPPPFPLKVGGITPESPGDLWRQEIVGLAPQGRKRGEKVCSENKR